MSENAHEGAEMFAKQMLTDAERIVDPVLGYPRGYAKLCRHAALQLQGLLTPFTEGPPQRFLPYSPQAEDFSSLKEWDSLFPVVNESERDPPNARKFAEELWQQLDHLGNAGFDPAKFRVDSYGNVVYWNADPSSPLAWEIDHWFPHSRGGRTVVTNLRVVQWQANQRKRNRLEFLVPWWDLQHGVSINQFLSAFASKNTDFRRRSFALFFAGGEDETVAREHVGECRPWPQQFRETKAQCGLAAAAIVSVPKDNEEYIRTYNTSGATVTSYDVIAAPVPAATGTPTRRRWSTEEEEALRRAVHKFGPGSWKEIKESEPALVNRSTVQIKDKFRVMRGEWQNSGKENIVIAPTANGRSDHLDRQSAATTALQKELRIKIMREEEKREKEEEIAQLEETVMTLKQQNEKERLTSLELEAILTRHKQRAEKQRRWAETQSSYRLCLERLIRDTMHQSISYKEQARLNQVACNALMARLDCQKATCEAAEKDLLQRYSQRGILEAANVDDLNDLNDTVYIHQKPITQGRDIVDVSSCVSLRAVDEEQEEEKVILPGDEITDSDSDSEDETVDEVYNLRRERRHSKEVLHQKTQQEVAWKSLDKQVVEDGIKEADRKVAVDDAGPKVHKESELVKSKSSKAKVQEGTAAPVMRATEGGERFKPDVNDEDKESEGDSDFADDEMSRELRESSGNTTEMAVVEETTFLVKEGARRQGSVGDRSEGNDLEVVPVDYEFAEAPVPEPAEDLPVPSAREARPDSKQEDQKNVIMVQTDTSKMDTLQEIVESGIYCKQEYLDELLQQVRFQIPTMEVPEELMDGVPLRKQEDHLDELLQQVLTTHVERIRRNEAASQQASSSDDEKIRQIGKSNLDKWLQVLLFKELDSAGSSPAQDSPLHRALSPALSQLSMAAMRGSMELEIARDQEFLKKAGGNMDRPKGLWGGLLRKLSVKQQSEQSLSHKMDEESDEEAQKQQISTRDADVTNLLDSMKKISIDENAHNVESKNVEGKSTDGPNMIPDSVKNWPEVGIQKAAAVAPELWHADNNTDVEETPTSDATTIWRAEGRVEDGVVGYGLDQHFSIERRFFPRSLSDVDEITETESLNSTNLDFHMLESKDPYKTGLRASIKAATLVWKKAVKKLETKLQEVSGSDPS